MKRLAATPTFAVPRRAGHLVAVHRHTTELFGTTWQPECIEDGCNYLGPHLASKARALAVAAEHRTKSTGKWKAAR